MKKGINSWCLPETLTLKEKMKITAEAGLEGLEINMEEKPKPKNLNLNLESSAKEISKIKKLAEEASIQIPSIATSLFWNYPLTSNQEDIRNKAREIIKKMIDAAEILNADSILVVPGIVNEEVSYKKAYSRSLHNLNEVKDYAEEKQINIGVENVWNKFLLSPLEMNQFLEEIDSSYVGAYFDAGNVLDFSYPEYWIEILAEKIVKVHVKDFKTSIGNINGFTHLLQGDVNWEKVVKALREVNYDSYLTAELAQYNYFPEQIAEDTAAALSKILRL